MRIEGRTEGRIEERTEGRTEVRIEGRIEGRIEEQNRNPPFYLNTELTAILYSDRDFDL